MIIFERAIDDQSLVQILELQRQNLKENLSQEERDSQGFVTAKHTFKQLKEINLKENAVIATSDGKVIAYAIAMKRETGKGMPVFDRLFEEVDKIKIGEIKFTHFPYIFVGQLCIAKEFRGQGLVEKLYAFFSTEMQNKYDFIVTDISQENPRSLKAHEKSGYKKIQHFFDFYNNSYWDIVIKDLRNN
jgi:L-amino acid N-acyltransferase YncA